MIDYSPLWETMAKKQVSTYTLIKVHHFSSRTIHSLRHNESITLNTLERLCTVLDCSPSEVFKFVKD